MGVQELFAAESRPAAVRPWKDGRVQCAAHCAEIVPIRRRADNALRQGSGCRPTLRSSPAKRVGLPRQRNAPGVRPRPGQRIQCCVLLLPVTADDQESHRYVLPSSPARWVGASDQTGERPCAVLGIAERLIGQPHDVHERHQQIVVGNGGAAGITQDPSGFDRSARAASQNVRHVRM